MRRLLGFWCRRVGHRDAFWMLPEEEFGLYAFSRYYCGRCETTFQMASGVRAMTTLGRFLDWVIDGMPGHMIGDSKPRRDTPRPAPVRPPMASGVRASGWWSPTVSATPSTEALLGSNPSAGMASGVTSRPAPSPITEETP